MKATCLFALLSLALGCTSASAEEITIDFSTSLNASNTTPTDFLVIVDGAIASPVVDLLAGADVRALIAQDFSTVNFHGGKTENDASADDFAIVNVFSGAVGDDLWARGNSTVNVFGGSIGPGGIVARDNGVINIHGGDLSSNLVVSEFGVINVFGFDLSIEDETLSGTLADGTAVIQSVRMEDSGQVVLHEVPEPDTLILTILGLMAACVWRKRRGEKVPSIPDTFFKSFFDSTFLKESWNFSDSQSSILLSTIRSFEKVRIPRCPKKQKSCLSP